MLSTIKNVEYKRFQMVYGRVSQNRVNKINATISLHSCNIANANSFD